MKWFDWVAILLILGTIFISIFVGFPLWNWPRFTKRPLNLLSACDYPGGWPCWAHITGFVRLYYRPFQNFEQGCQTVLVVSKYHQSQLTKTATHGVRSVTYPPQHTLGWTNHRLGVLANAVSRGSSEFISDGVFGSEVVR